MNYISVENISKAYGELELFSNLSFGINKGQKIGLVAKNGAGKTSLLNLLSGKEPPDQGEINYRKGLKVSFLSQDPNLDLNRSVEETILASENETLRVIAQYEKALLNPEDTEAYQEAFEKMEARQAWDFETEYHQILSELHLRDLSEKVERLSGGQRKRLALACILLDEPDLLILDEPTNHLDLEMIEWLEETFKQKDFTLFMVTHDRYFLERVCNEILELDNRQLYSYKGNYQYYLEKREQRLELEDTNASKAKQLYKKELDWLRRQPKARGTKSKSRIDAAAEIRERAQQQRSEEEVELEINMERLGAKIIELHNISKAFGGKTLFEHFTYNFQRKDRLGIVGKNGSGKTSFLNILTGELKADTGKVVIGDTLKFGYYKQNGLSVKQGQKVIDVIREFGDYIPLKKGRQISASQLLERFLFDRKKQYDYVEKLSGGERKRLYLCTILIQNPNFLILDEPTNDLDVITINVLENFLLDFPGCLVVVSHDRYFMDKIIDHLFVFEKGTIKDFPGNYSMYRAQAKHPLKEDRKGEKEEQEQVVAKKQRTSLSYHEQKELQQIEREIEHLEERKVALQNEFLKPLEGEEIEKKSLELGQLEQEIDQKTERWFVLSQKKEDTL